MLHSFTDPMIKRITQTVLCVAAFLAGSWTAAAAPTPMFSGEENMRWGVSAILEAAKAITAEPLPSLNAGSTRTGAPLTRGGVRGGPGIPNPFGWPAADQDMVCALGISSVGVGECTFNEATGQARTLVAVYLTWVDPPAGQVINVTFKGQTKSLNPAVKAIPPFVQFIVPADGSTGTVTAQFSGGACVAAPTVVTLPANCTPPVCGGAGSVGGRVFNDYNNNGSRQLSEVGVQDVTVSVYDDFDQLLCTTTTAVNGLWRCFGIEDNAKVRVEFTLPAKFEVGKPGANSASAVQFGTEGQCNVDLGIFETKDYMDPDPWMMIPCYTKGLVTPGNPMANEPTIVGNRYSTPNGNRAVTGPGGNYYVASASETGTVWGVAYEPKAKALLSAAFMRRHSAFGPGGLGAIYKTDMTTFLNNPEANAPSYRYYGNTQVWLNLDSFGIVTGDETSITRDIPSNPTAPNRDSDVWTRMGKWGLGDMDFNETFDTLFVVNLHNRTLVTIRTGNPFPQNPNSIPASNVSETVIPDPGCSANGDWRPFALKYRNGALYVGGVCTAESTQNAKDMRVVVYKYENGTFNEVVSQPLNYTKGVVQSPCADFIPWSNSWSAGVNRFGGTAVCGPMPMLADIEFDSYGNMILGIGDRAGYNIGWGDLSPNAGDNTLYNGFAGGDIIKLYNNNGQYLMENNATTGYFTSAGANNGEGLNGGEFYYQDNLALCCHDETILGGLAVHPSDDAVIATVIDAAGVVANGWKMLSNTNGAAAKVYDIFVWSGGDNSFSKAAGLGDIELLQSSSAAGALTIQIGNYIWLDQDLDGVQDPSEPPVVGMPVQLYKKVNGVPTPVATTTTNALGQYYFDNLLPNMDYIVVVGNPSSYNKPLGLFSANGKTYMATQANANTNGGNDENDSDATPGDASLGALAGLYSICFTTGELGENNYTYDFGVVLPGVGNRVWKDDNFNGRQEIGEAGVQGVIVKMHVCNPNGTPGAVLPGYTTVTSPTGYYNFQNMPAGNYALSFDYSGLPNANDVYFSIPNIEGNTVDSADSDVKYVLPGNALEYTACFAWDGDSTKFDYTFDAGIVCDKDFDGVPDDYDVTDLLIDPTGYLYCENTGEILDGGLITVSGPGNVYMIYNGSAGYYQFFVDKTGVYTIGVQDPATFVRSTKCLDLGFLDAPDSLQVFNPYSVGSGNDNPDDFLDDYTCPTNRLYLTMLLEPGDFIVNNNIPYQCADRGDLPAPFATLEADNGPLHGVMQTPHLYMGTLIDKETDGAPEACAGEETGGDDGTASDDEDGIITMPDFVISLTSTVPVRVLNRTGTTAKLYGFMDYNNDKDFDDLNEMVMVSVPNNTNPQTFNLNFPIPVDAAIRTKIGLRLRLSLDSNLGPNGPTRFGEIEDYVVEILGADLGDLPETYNTSGTDNPPMHRVTPNLKLGASVDAEKDGNPDAMAGSMGGGDDGNVGLVTFGTSNPAGDDENGIMLVSPLMPGMTATLMVDAMNMTGSPAVLQGWIDFNTNGTFEANEQLTTGSFAPSGAVVPNGGLNGAKLTFNVPANATFIGGNAFARFRLSPQGGLAPDSELPDPPFGEIEDYKFPLAKVGNIVFEDYDFDGVQDAGEPGIDGVNVMLTWAGPNGIIGDADDVMYTTTTGPAGGFQTGEYYFCELIAGTYKVKFTTPDHMTPTRSNIGGNVSDSDGTITGMDLSMAMETFTIASTINLPTGENGLGDNGVNPTDTYPDNQVDETHDQGFAFLDYGDLPESGSGDQFNTTMVEGGAVHVIIPGLKLGASVDGERDGAPNAAATGDDITNTGSTDDEDGISFPTPLVPGYNATILVSAMNMTGTNAFLEGWIDWNNNGLLDASEELAFSNNGIIPNGGVTNAPFTFPVPSTAIFNDGMVFARFRLSRTGGLSADGPDKYNPSTTVPQGEVEDYMFKVAKLGNLVFADADADGVQDANEFGIDGVTVQVIWAGPDANINTTGDNVTYETITGPASGKQTGEYYVCGLIAGTYKVVFMTPTHFTVSKWDVGNQTNGGTLDSDGQTVGMDQSMAMELITIGNVTNLPLNENGLGDGSPNNVGTFPDNQTDETHDQGFFGLDYGDLPETGNGDQFSTNMAKTGAIHVVIPALKLGATIDVERDGFPTADALGDDNANHGSADDEDGIVFATPLIPGNSATIRVSAMNMLGANAVLQGWIDWNNNGLLDATEALVFTNGGVVPVGGVTNAAYTFPVPSTAIFNDGMVFARFRLSPAGGLGPNGPDKLSGAPIPFGEVEDYMLKVAKVGNVVWEDLDYDGVQDLTEPGIGNVTMQLLWAGADGNLNTAGDNVTYTVTTLAAASGGNVIGEYNFCGLIPGTYKITAITPQDMSPTFANVGSQINGGYLDSDGTGAANMPMTDPFTITAAGVVQQPTGENGIGDNAPNALGTFPDNQTNESFDFGFVAIDFGDLPDTYVTDDNPQFSGAQHVIQPLKYLGACVDAETQANIDATGNAGMWVGGDDFTTSAKFYGTCGTPADDENGVVFLTPLVPGYEARVRVTYTALDIPGIIRTGNTFLSGWLDYNNNDQFDAGEQVITDLALATGTNVAIDVPFTVPGTVAFNGGRVRARFRIHCQKGLGSAGLTLGGEVEDYYIPLAKTGNYVWFDNDLRGDEMTTNSPKTFLAETGINDVDMVLVWGGPDGNLQTAADNRVYRKPTFTGTQGENQDGIYYFCGLIGGQYTVVPRKYVGNLTGMGADSIAFQNPILAHPTRKILTIANNAGNDYKDSDGTPAYAFTVPNLLAAPNVSLNVLNESGLGDLPTIYSFPDRLTDLSMDFGFIQEPNIEANQQISGIEKGAVCGQFKIVADLCLTNTGGYENGYVMATPLNSIQANVPLASQLGSAFVMTMGTPQIMNGNWECGEAPLPQQLPQVNPNYNGTTDTRLFLPNTGLLWPGEKVVVRYVFEVRPTNVPEPQSLNLQFQAAAEGRAVNYQGQPIPNFYQGGGQYIAADLSNHTLDLDGTYDDTDIPNSIGPCWKQTQNVAANDLVYVDLDDATCTAEINESMILEGEPEHCIDNAFCLGGYYRFKITDNIGKEVPNPIPAAYVGQMLTVEVENIVSCNKWWGKLIVEDKDAPQLSCADITVSCNAGGFSPDELQALGVANAKAQASDCSTFTLISADDIDFFDCSQNAAFGQRITRVWTATDKWGNKNQCIQTINVQRPTLATIAKPGNYDDLSKPSLDCSGGYPTPAVTGEPVGCNTISYSYEDEVLQVCPSSYTIIRTWTLNDMCSGNTAEHVQTIKVTDKTAPVLFCPDSKDVVVGKSKKAGKSCTATVELPWIQVTDDCSTNDKMTVYAWTQMPDGSLQIVQAPNAGGKFVFEMPVGGIYTFTYSAIDGCGNKNECTVTAAVNDVTPPTVVCETFHVVALSDSVTLVNASSFDDGSSDECTSVTFAVRRGTMNASGAFVQHPCNQPGDFVYADKVRFYCCDGLSATPLFVDLRVRDAWGNDNFCMVPVTVVDKVKPVIWCPENVTVECGMPYAPAQPDTFHTEVEPKMAIANAYANTYTVPVNVSGIPAEAKLTDLNLQLTITHEATNQLRITLVSPKGTKAEVLNANGCSGQAAQYPTNIDVLFDDEAYDVATYNVTGQKVPAAFTCLNANPSIGAYNGGWMVPQGDELKVMDGEGLNGTWQLIVEDTAPLAGGMIHTVGLHLEFASPLAQRPVVTDNTEECGLTLSHIDLGSPDECPDNEFINRRWSVVDAFGNNTNCVQRIYFNDATPLRVNFPCNTTTTCPSDPSNTGEVTHNADCEVPGVEYTDQKLTTTDGCYKILRTWVLKDWCKYQDDGNIDYTVASVNPAASEITFTTAINPLLTARKIEPGDRVTLRYVTSGTTEIGGMIEGDVYSLVRVSGTTFRVEWNSDKQQSVSINAAGTGPHIFRYGNSAYGFGSTCTQQWEDDGDGYFSYVQEIKVVDTEAPTFADCTNAEYCSFEENCGPTAITLKGEATDNCADAADLHYEWSIDANNDGTTDITGTGSDASGSYPLGTHRITFKVTDRCGNWSTCVKLFTIRDCKKPTPVCINGLSVDLMPSTGMATVLATSLESGGSKDNCTSYGKLQYRVERKSTVSTGQTAPDADAAASLNVNCDDYNTNGGELEVVLWVGDEAGNWDYCITKLWVQDNMGACGSGSVAALTAYTANEDGESVEKVTVELSGASTQQQITGTGGTASFGGLWTGQSVTVTPVKDIHPLNGVSTYDLLLIQKHLLGIKALNSPYKLIAADVNSSANISISDIIELRKMILTPGLNFKDNTSWRFVEAGHVFANPSKPFGFPETKSFKSLNAGNAANFVAVKVGDVSGDHTPNTLLGSETRNSVGTLTFSIAEQNLVAGQKYTVAVRAENFRGVQGYQYTMDFNTDVVEFEGVDAVWTDLSEANFGRAKAGEGVLTTSWNGSEGVTLTDGDVLYTVTFRAKANGKLSQALKVNSRVTKAEAYDAAEELLDIRFRFDGGVVSGGEFALYQNEPNPFGDMTTIGFELPAATKATLTVYDVTGKVLKVLAGDYAKGYHRIMLQRSELQGHGMLYYRLDTDTDTATKRMILAD